MGVGYGLVTGFDENSVSPLFRLSNYGNPSNDSSAQRIALAPCATSFDLQAQSADVENLAEKEAILFALPADSLWSSSMLEIKGTFLVDQDKI